MESWLSLTLTIFLGIVLFFIVLPESKKLVMAAFGLAVLLIFAINIQTQSVLYSLSKLVTAVIAVVILNISPVEEGDTFFGGLRTGVVFRVATIVLTFVFVLFVSQTIAEFFNIDAKLAAAALLLIACGFVQIGTSIRTFRIILGLLVMLQGFEILYGTIENSILVNGLISMVDLLIALVGSYLLNQAHEDVTE